jgi:hypothetical protein
MQRNTILKIVGSRQSKYSKMEGIRLDEELVLKTSGPEGPCGFESHSLRRRKFLIEILTRKIKKQ